MQALGRLARGSLTFSHRTERLERPAPARSRVCALTVHIR